MHTDTELEEILQNTPKNRKARRKLLKRQGWYFEVDYPVSMAGDQQHWICYKVYRNGKKELYKTRSQVTAS